MLLVALWLLQLLQVQALGAQEQEPVVGLQVHAIVWIGCLEIMEIELG